MREIKNQRFKPGQQAVCTHKGKWLYDGPAFNEAVEIECYSNAVNPMFPDQQYVYIKGYTHTFTDGSRVDYNEKFFEPLVSDSILERELEEVIKMEEQTR